MASVASVAVELYEFCFFLLPLPHGASEAGPQSKVSSLMSSLPSTPYMILFKTCLSELTDLIERSENHMSVIVLCKSMLNHKDYICTNT